MFLLHMLGLTISLKFTSLPNFITYTHYKIRLTCKTDVETRIIWMINGTIRMKGPSIVLWGHAQVGTFQCIAIDSQRKIYSPIIELVIPKSFDQTEVILRKTEAGLLFRYSKLPVKYFQPNQIVCDCNYYILDSAYAYLTEHVNSIRCYDKDLKSTTALYEVVLALISESKMIYPPEDALIEVTDPKEGICISGGTKKDEFTYQRNKKIVSLSDMGNGRYSCENAFGDMRHFTLRIKKKISVQSTFGRVTKFESANEYIKFECHFDDGDAEIRWFFDEKPIEIKNIRNEKTIYLRQVDVFESDVKHRLLSCFVINQFSMDYKQTLLARSQPVMNHSNLSSQANDHLTTTLIVMTVVLAFIVVVLIVLLYSMNRRFLKVVREIQFNKLHTKTKMKELDPF